MTRHFLIGAVSAAALFAGAPALAQSNGDVLEGADAFGGYEESQPGVTRHITPDALPEASPDDTSANWPEPVSMPGDATLNLPEGFSAEMIAQGIEQPRVIEFAPNGDMFVANSAGNEILVYTFGDDGEATEHTFATDALNQPYGIAFYPQDNPEWVYVGNADGIVRFPYSGGTEAEGEAEVLVEGIPPNHHWTRDLAFSPDGETMYYAVGSGSNVAEQMEDTANPPSEDWIENHPTGAIWGAEEWRATVLAFNPDGSDQRIFATGIRNCSGLTVQPATGNLWCVTNERDGLGDNVPFDYATHVEEGQFYGWPWYYIGDNEDPRLAGERPDLAEEVAVPDVLFQSHSAPLNIAFMGDQWGEDYAGDAVVAMHGSWNRGTRTGYKVVQLGFENGEADGTYTDFATGFLTDDGDVWGRPVGVAQGPDGALYISEDGNGTIWRVTRDQ